MHRMGQTFVIFRLNLTEELNVVFIVSFVSHSFTFSSLISLSKGGQLCALGVIECDSVPFTLIISCALLILCVSALMVE